MVVIILTLIAVFFVGGFLFYLGYLCGGYNSDNQCEDEIIELKRELIWYKKQHAKAIQEIEALNRWIISRDEPATTKVEQNKEQITKLYISGKTNKEIADKLHVSTSTIQRATRKRGLSEQYGKGRSGRKKNVGM